MRKQKQRSNVIKSEDKVKKRKTETATMKNKLLSFPIKTDILIWNNRWP